MDGKPSSPREEEHTLPAAPRAYSRAAPLTRERILDAAAIAFLVSSGFLLRYALLTVKFPFIDEFWELYIANQGSMRAVLRTITSMGPLQAPLDYLLVSFAAKETSNLYWLRMLPLIWGMGSIVAAYLLGKRIHGRLLGWFWSLLVAFSALHIGYSDVLRPFSLAVFLTLASLCFFPIRRERVGWKFTVLQSLAQAAFPEAFFIGVSELLCALLFDSRKSAAGRGVRLTRGTARLAAHLIPSWVIFLAWYGPNASSVAQGAVFEYHFAPVESIVRAFRDFGQRSSPMAVLFLILFLIGARQMRLFLGIFVVSLSAIIGAHAAVHYFFETRHVISLLPIYLGVVARGLVLIVESVARLSRERIGREWIIAAVSIIMIAGSIQPVRSMMAKEAAWTDYWAKAADFVEKNARSEDVFIAANPNSGASFSHALDRSNLMRLAGFKIFRGFDIFLFPYALSFRVGELEIPAFTVCSLDSAFATIDSKQYQDLKKKIRKKGGRIWLLYLRSFNYIPEENPFPQLLDISPAGLAEPFDGIFLDT